VRINLKDRAYHFLLQEMMSGNLPAGSRLSEIQLAEKADISRTPIREAFRKLETMGLVKQVPNCGVFVEKLTPKEYEDLLELRELLEGFATGKAAEQITPEQVSELETCCRVHLELAVEARRSGSDKQDVQQVCRSIEADMRFHKTILNSSDNPRLIGMVDSLSLVSLVLARLIPEDFESNAADRYERVYREHSQITDALREHDRDNAARLAAEHIRRKKQIVLARYHAGHQLTSESSSFSEDVISQLSEHLLKSV